GRCRRSAGPASRPKNPSTWRTSAADRARNRRRRSWSARAPNRVLVDPPRLPLSGSIVRSINRVGIAGKFHRRVEAAVELRRNLVFLLALCEDLCGEFFRIVLGTVAQKLGVGVVPAAAQI